MSTKPKRRKNNTVVGKRPVDPPPVPSIVECPKCKGARFVRLAVSDAQQRLQCASEACGEHFGCPKGLAAGLDYVRADDDGSPVLGVGESVFLGCPKCRKPYQRGGKKLEAHIAKCDGTPFCGKQPTPERAGEQPPPSKPHAKAPPEDAAPPPWPLAEAPRHRLHPGRARLPHRAGGRRAGAHRRDRRGARGWRVACR